MPCLRGNKYDRCKRQKLQFLANVFLEVRRNAVGLRYQVPFVYDNDHGPAQLMRIPPNVRVDVGNALFAINNQQPNVAPFQMPSRHHYAQFFGFQFGLAFATHAGGIDKTNGGVVLMDDAVDGIPCSPGNRRNHGAFLADETIQQRRLSYIGTADDGYSNLVGGVFVIGFGLWKRFEHLVEKFRDSLAVLGRDWKDVVESEPVEIGNIGGLVLGVDFVDDEENGLLLATQQPREFLVGGGDGRSIIDDEQQDGRGIDCDFGLLENLQRNFGFVAGFEPAGVDNFEIAAALVGGGVNSVTCDAGLVGDDGTAGADKAIEESRFPDVGPADNGNEREWWWHEYLAAANEH